MFNRLSACGVVETSSGQCARLEWQRRKTAQCRAGIAARLGTGRHEARITVEAADADAALREERVGLAERIAIADPGARRADQGHGAQQPDHDRLLHVQPVLRLVEHHRLRPVDDLVGDLLAAVGGQAVHEEGVRLGHARLQWSRHGRRRNRQ